jgi:hypothetical protein
METERYFLNIINTFHGKGPVKEKFNTFDTLSEIRSLWEDRLVDAFNAMSLNEGFANPSEKTNFLTMLYTIMATIAIGLLIGIFIIAFSSFNMSWAYNKALGKSDLETSYWATLCFIFFIAYFPYYGIILQPLRIKSQDSMTAVLAGMITPFIQVGLPTWQWAFSGLFNA